MMVHRVTPELVAAARLRLVIDAKLERETPEHVKRIAHAEGASPWTMPKVVPVRVLERRERVWRAVEAVAWVTFIIGLLYMTLVAGILAYVRLVEAGLIG